jgi:hypothetical protein
MAGNADRSLVTRIIDLGSELGEIGIGLGIAAVVIIGWLTVSWKMETAGKATRSLEELHILVDAVHALYRGQPHYCPTCENGDMAQVLIEKGMIPRDMLGSGPDEPLVDAFGGPAYVTVDKNAGLPEFNVKFTQLNYGSCVALASEEFGSDLREGNCRVNRLLDLLLRSIDLKFSENKLAGHTAERR